MGPSLAQGPHLDHRTLLFPLSRPFSLFFTAGAVLPRSGPGSPLCPLHSTPFHLFPSSHPAHLPAHARGVPSFKQRAAAAATSNSPERWPLQISTCGQSSSVHSCPARAHGCSRMEEWMGIWVGKGIFDVRFFFLFLSHLDKESVKSDFPDLAQSKPDSYIRLMATDA